LTACKNDGIPEPEYTVRPADIMLKFTAHPDRIIPSGHAVVRDGFENVTDIVTDVTDIVTDNLTDKESLVLKLIIENNFIPQAKWQRS
jgi:ATP-dependent DNA helicase RecG